MADNLDKFVIQYIVETKDSLKKLEQMVNKMDEVEKKGGKGGKAIHAVGNALKSLAGELGGAGEGATALADGLGAVAAVAGPIAAVVGVVMLLKKALSETKSVMAELLSQRNLGQQVGMSALSVENITRNLRNAKGSQLSQKDAENIISNISSKVRTAYADPNQMNRDAITLRQIGVNINGPSGGINSTGEVLKELSQRFKDSTAEQARAYGNLIGLTNQQVDAMRALGSAIGDTTHLSAEEAARREEAMKRTNELVAASTKLSEHWRELKDDILIEIIPAIDALVKALDGIAEWVSRHATEFRLAFKMGIDPLHAIAIYEASKNYGKSSAIIHKSAKDIVKSADIQNKTSYQQTSNMERIINMFGQSVAQFSDTIDERQAWAAWAGEIGRANGLSTSGNKSYGLTGTAGNGFAFHPAVRAVMEGNAPAQSAPDSHVFDSIYQKASAATGLPATFIKKVAMAESGQNPIAKSKKGALGIMQLMPSNIAAFGVTNALNPLQNIMAGARLLAQLVKEYGNYNDALRAYNGGQDRSRWGNKETANYVNRVLSQNATISDSSNFPDANNRLLSPLMRYQMDPNAKPQFTFSGKRFVNLAAGGESREKMQIRNIQQLLAQQIGGGVTLQQVQTGDVSLGDEQYAASNMMASMLNSRYLIKNKLGVPGMTVMQRSALQQQLRTTDLQIQGMMRYMPQIQARAMPGARNITIGQGAVQVIVQGAHVTAKELAEEINSVFTRHFAEVTNGYADGISH